MVAVPTFDTFFADRNQLIPLVIQLSQHIDSTHQDVAKRPSFNIIVYFVSGAQTQPTQWLSRD